MRMTKATVKSAVNAIVAAIPTTDYVQLSVECLQQEVNKSLPRKVREVMEDKDTAHYLETHHTSGLIPTDGYVRTCYITGRVSDAVRNKVESSSKIVRFTNLNKAQEAMLKEARTKVFETLSAYTTVKAAREALPELAQYLPEVVKVKKNLPSPTGLITTLMESGFKFAK